MKKLLIIQGLLLLAKLAVAQHTIVITGHVKEPVSQYSKIYLRGEGIKEDSARILNGTFTFQMPYKEPVVAILHSEYDVQVRKSFRMAVVVIDRPGEVIMDSIDLTRGMNSAVIKGLQSARDFPVYEKMFTEVRKSVAASLPPMPDYGTPEYEERVKKFDSAYSVMLSPALISAAKAYGDTYSFAVILNDYGKAASPEALEEAYQLLSPAMQTSTPGMQVKFYLEGLKKSVAGMPVEDFTLSGPDGKDLTFSKLKGKYVMIDFWASWCVPCRESFPRMRTLYEKYKGKPFEILGISIDRRKPDWDKAILEEKLPWPQVLDTKSIATRLFVVTAVPTAYLIGPDGKIILNEVGFEENGAIEQELKKLFP